MGRFFPFLYDLGMKSLEENRFKEIRRTLLENAVGRVLEIGAGSGINFPLYRNVERVDAIEPDPFMRKRAEIRKASAAVPIQLYSEKAEGLPFPDETFDTVTATLVFCTIPDPASALAEIKRVSKPGANLLFFEHIKMDQPLLAKSQDLLTPLWKKVCDSCHLNRDTLKIIKTEGYEIESLEYYGKGLFVSGIGKRKNKFVK